MFLLVFSLCSCGLQEREASLNARERALQSQQQMLDARALTLQQREDALTQKLQKLDSLSHDSAMLYEPQLIGRWAVRMTCTETSCPGSALGDVKSEVWDISYEENALVAKAMVKNSVVRIYSGKSNRDGIQLAESVPSEPVGNAVVISISLKQKGANMLEGERVIARENDCRIVYALQLSKQ
ncbi:MAG: hypothetical protein JST06_08855 [Bacteroidetes bacterium]|nr:hypothetical protein [Bacteroidota bacterium]MBS1630243.1 hypothetical protein [Bacteroidota bacterium]